MYPWEWYSQDVLLTHYPLPAVKVYAEQKAMHCKLNEHLLEHRLIAAMRIILIAHTSPLIFLKLYLYMRYNTCILWICHHGTAHPQVVDGDGFQLWRVAVNILNKQTETNDKGWSSSLGVGLITSHCKH
jgi:hypothetical protein